MELLYADNAVLIAGKGDGKEGSESECWKDKNHVV